MANARRTQIPIREFWPFFASIVVILGMIVAILMVIFPHATGLWERWQNVQAGEEKLSRLKKKRAFLESLDLPLTQKRLVLVEQALPSSKNVFPIFATMRGLTLEYHNAPGDFHLSPGLLNPQNPDLQTITFPITMSVPQAQVVPLITTIDSLLPFFTIGHVNIASLASDQSSVNMDLSTYFQALPKTYGDIESPVETLSPKEEELLSSLALWKSYPELDLRSLEATVPAKRKNPFSL